MQKRQRGLRPVGVDIEWKAILPCTLKIVEKLTWWEAGRSHFYSWCMSLCPRKGIPVMQGSLPKVQSPRMSKHAIFPTVPLFRRAWKDRFCQKQLGMAGSMFVDLPAGQSRSAVMSGSALVAMSGIDRWEVRAAKLEMMQGQLLLTLFPSFEEKLFSKNLEANF